MSCPPNLTKLTRLSINTNTIRCISASDLSLNNHHISTVKSKVTRNRSKGSAIKFCLFILYHPLNVVKRLHFALLSWDTTILNYLVELPSYSLFQETILWVSFEVCKSQSCPGVWVKHVPKKCAGPNNNNNNNTCKIQFAVRQAAQLHWQPQLRRESILVLRNWRMR